jgi:hypothetical protein
MALALSLALSGATRADIQVRPSVTSSFATVPVGSSADLTFSVTVGYSGPLNVLFNGDHASDFQVVTPLPTFGAPCVQESHTFSFTVRFTPSSVGSRYVQMSVLSGSQFGCGGYYEIWTYLVGTGAAPAITVPANMVVPNDAGKCSDGGTVTCNPASGSFFPVGTTTVNCSTALGATASFKVTVNDTEKPVISTLPDLTGVTDEGQCTASLGFSPPTATDNCAAPTVVCTVGGTEITSPHAFPIGTTTVTCTATDAAGNTASRSFVVTVTDGQKLQITAPPNLRVNTDPGQSTALVSSAALGTASATDNCPGVTISASGIPAGNRFPLGTTTITWTAVGAGGSSASCTQTVTVEDAEKPAFTNCPPPGSTALATCTTSGAGALVSFAPLSATDNGGTAIVSYDHTSGSFFPPGNTTVTATATDAAGNTTTCPFTVTVACAWSGILQPINIDGSSVFKAGSTIPVKFALTGDSACITSLAATLAYAKGSDGVAGEVNEAVSTSAATTGNLFRYTDGQYLFNWNTKGLAIGTYELQIDLGDGVTHTVRLGLK